MVPPSNWFREFMTGYGVEVGRSKPHRSQPGPPMTLANMRALGVHRIAVHCLAPYCQHTAVLDASTYDAALPVKAFEPRMACTRCGLIGADVRPNWMDYEPTKTRR
jgi:hypothetical protein